MVNSELPSLSPFPARPAVTVRMTDVAMTCRSPQSQARTDTERDAGDRMGAQEGERGCRARTEGKTESRIAGEMCRRDEAMKDAAATASPRHAPTPSTIPPPCGVGALLMTSCVYVCASVADADTRKL
ncbi:hypothetical protein VTO73DRAFT_10179 [Trametes versicolor]